MRTTVPISVTSEHQSYRWSTALLLTISSAFALFAASLIPGMPLGQYWWDNLALSGAAWAIDTGLTPSVDFWAPLIAPLYLKWAAIQIGGFESHVFVECVIQGMIALALFIVLNSESLSKRTSLVLGTIVVLVATIPANHSNAISSAAGWINYAGNYNRLCDALLMVLFLLPLQPDRAPASGGGQIIGPIALGLLVGLLFYTKISAFQVALGYLLVVLFMLNHAGLRRDIIIGLLLSLAGGLLIWWMTGIGPTYLTDLADIAQTKSSLLGETTELRLHNLWQRHEVELVALAIFTLWLGKALTRSQASWRQRMAIASLYACAVSGTLLFTLTNYGDMGLTPFVACFYCVYVMTRRHRRRDTSRLEKRLPVLIIVCCLLEVFAFYARWSLGFVRKDRLSELEHLPVNTHFFHDHFLVTQKDWQARPSARALSKADIPQRHQPPNYATYVQLASDVSIFLGNRYPTNTKVYLIDFPAYLFSLTNGFAIPAGAPPWLLYGHEVTDRHTNRLSVWMKEADVIVLSTCSLHQPNRDKLIPLTKPTLKQHFREVYRTTCWTVHEKAARA